MDTTFLFVILIAFILISSTIVLALGISVPETTVAPTEDEAYSLDTTTSYLFNDYIEYTLFGF
jgi:hypothetical protein